MVRLIALDMDGTLLIHGIDGIPKENADALRAASEKGVHLALCTGRVAEDASFFAEDAGLDMFILGVNGGYGLDHPHGACIRDEVMTREQAQGVCACIERFPKLLYGVYGADRLVMSYPVSRRPECDYHWGTYLFREGTRQRLTWGHESLEEVLTRGVNKIALIDEEIKGDMVTLQKMIEAEVPGVDVCSSWVNNLEIMPKGVHKGSSVEALARKLGIPMSDVMCMGDNDNDIPMLTSAGYGVAMANSTPGALNAAQYRTGLNSEFGVAQAVRRFVLDA